MADYKSSASFYSEGGKHFNQAEVIDDSVYFGLSFRDKGFFTPYVVPGQVAPEPVAQGPSAEHLPDTGEILIGDAANSDAAGPVLEAAGPETTSSAEALQESPSPQVSVPKHKETLLQHVAEFEQMFVNAFKEIREKIESLFEPEPAK